MKHETREWLEKAVADLRTAEREFAAVTFPNYDAVCFHAQQCAEKQLKAYMVESEISFPRTHDLELLVKLVMSIAQHFESLLPSARNLTAMAVEVRYPGMSVDSEDAEYALKACKNIYDYINANLYLSDETKGQS